MLRVMAQFLVDMGFQFVLMRPLTHITTEGLDASGGVWLMSHRAIAKEYMLSWWFYLDFFSIGVSGLDIFSPEDSGVSRLKALRAIRALRMLKLVRLARGSRIFKRWEMRLSINCPRAVPSNPRVHGSHSVYPCTLPNLEPTPTHIPGWRAVSRAIMRFRRATH